MKCQACGAPIEQGEFCFDCKRDEIERERAQTRIAREEEFHRKLFRDQLSDQQKLAEAQIRELDFRETRRALLNLEMTAQDNPTVAKKRAAIFFASKVFDDHWLKLLEIVVASEFLLDGYCAHQLQSICGHNQGPEGIDWFLDFYSDSSSLSLRKVYTTLVAMAQACDPVTAGLHSELVETIKTHPTRREAEQKQEEEEKRQKWEKFLLAYQKMHQLARLPMVAKPPADWVNAVKQWFVRTFPFTPVQREERRRFQEEQRQRQAIIDGLVSWIEEGMVDFRTESGRDYPTQEMYVMALLWFESRHDRRLIVLVVSHHLRQEWRNIRTTVATAVDEFERRRPRFSQALEEYDSL